MTDTKTRTVWSAWPNVWTSAGQIFADGDSVDLPEDEADQLKKLKAVSFTKPKNEADV